MSVFASLQARLFVWSVYYPLWSARRLLGVPFLWLAVLASVPLLWLIDLAESRHRDGDSSTDRQR